MELHPVIYNLMIDPLLEGVRSRVLSQLKPGLKVIDIASGTGQLAMDMAAARVKVTGVDIEPSMIRYSIKKSNGLVPHELRFLEADAKFIHHFDHRHFDLATMSLALHQFPSGDWEAILQEAMRISEELVIADYFFPLPAGIKKHLVYTIERIAGKHHYQCFREFMNAGGVVPIIQKAGFTCIHQEMSGSGIFGIYRIKK